MRRSAAIGYAVVALSACHDTIKPARIGLLDVGEQTFAQACPKPIVAKEKTVSNRYVTGAIDTIKTLACDGMEEDLYVSVHGSNPNGLVIRVAISKPTSSLPNHVNVGQTREQIISALGAPSEASEQAITYYPEPGESSVTFFFDAGKVKSIVWNPYWD